MVNRLLRFVHGSNRSSTPQTVRPRLKSFVHTWGVAGVAHIWPPGESYAPICSNRLAHRQRFAAVDVFLFDFRVQGIAGDAQEFGGLADVAAGFH